MSNGRTASSRSASSRTTPAIPAPARTAPARRIPLRPTILPNPHAPAPVPTPFETAVPTACTGADPELFFDEENPAPALAICAGCPARAACLAYALDSEEFGIWGGTTPEQRVALRGGVILVSPEERLAAAEIRARIAAGAQVDEVARHCQVSSRTMARWLAQERTDPHFGSREDHAA